VRDTLRSRLDGDAATVTELVCFCLGDLESPSVAYQLAFYLLLANELKIAPERRLVFDPLHIEEDREALRQCGCNPFTPTPEEQDCKRAATCPTLFFMPYAPYTLTDNVVRANWGSLHAISVVGNGFDWIASNPWDDHRCNNEERAGPREKLRRTRAPCVYATRGVREEEILWKSDFETWIHPAVDPTNMSTGNHGDSEGDNDGDGGSAEEGVIGTNSAEAAEGIRGTRSEAEEPFYNPKWERQTSMQHAIDCTFVSFPPAKLWLAAKSGVDWHNYQSKVTDIGQADGARIRTTSAWSRRSVWTEMAAWPTNPPPIFTQSKL
jgi:hypothetical protein